MSQRDILRKASRRKIIEKKFLKGLVSGSVGYVPFLWDFIHLHKVKTVGNTLGNAGGK
jgi:hypothetical protein